MGGDVGYMRYTEQDNEIKFESFYDYVRNIIVLLIIGPLRLIKEVSTKVVFISREAIRKVLLSAVAIQIVLLALQIIINILLGIEFTILSGRVPIIVHVVSAVLLLTLNFAYSAYDFLIYQQLEKFLPAVTGVSLSDKDTQSDEVKEAVKEEPNDLQFDNFEDLDKIIRQTGGSNSNEPDLTELDTSFLESIESVSVEPVKVELKDILPEYKDLVNEELYENEDVFAFQNELEIALEDTETLDKQYNGPLNNSEIEQIKDNMDKSREPSKYISEDNLKLFLNKIGMDNFGTIDDLSNWCTPKEFSLVT